MKRISQCINALQNGDLKKAYTIIDEVKNNGMDEEKFALAEELRGLGFLEESQTLYKRLLDSTSWRRRTSDCLGRKLYQYGSRT